MEIAGNEDFGVYQPTSMLMSEWFGIWKVGGEDGLYDPSICGNVKDVVRWLDEYPDDWVVREQ
jgi:hypothetical protein